jgi:3-oxoacyl-[acyl-carrier-protein] synthase II
VPRDVVVTGVGALTPAGRGSSVLAASVRSAHCSLAIDPELDALGMRCRVSGRLRDVDASFAELPLDGVSPDFFSRHARIGAIAAQDAIASADGAAIGRVVVASAAGPMGELELCFRDTLADEPHPKRAHAVTRVTPSFLATHLARAVRAPRGGKAISCACVGAIAALREAVELVAHGIEDAVLVGAVEEDSPSTWWAFDAQRLLARARKPAERGRALSGRATGFAPAGGAAFFVVEAQDAAIARGARSRAKISGVTLRSAGTASSPLAFPLAAYREVLADVRAFGGAPIDLVLAHAPPTVADPDELAVLDETLAIVAEHTPVRSFKSLLGYALGAAAAIDVVLAIEQLERGEVLPNDPTEHRERVARFTNVLAPNVRRCAPRRILKTAYAQSGIAGAVVIDAA